LNSHGFGAASRVVKPARRLSAAKKVAAAAPSVAAKVSASVGAGAKAVLLPSDSAATIKKLTDNLRKMGGKRPTKPASLWRSLKSFLGAGATEESVEVALARLIEDGVVKVDSVKGASYPRFGPDSGSAVTQVEGVMGDRLVRHAVLNGVVLLLPGLGWPGRVPASRGRAVALRVEPLSKAQRLAPDGRPSLTLVRRRYRDQGCAFIARRNSQ